MCVEVVMCSKAGTRGGLKGLVERAAVGGGGMRDDEGGDDGDERIVALRGGSGMPLCLGSLLCAGGRLGARLDGLGAKFGSGRGLWVSQRGARGG